MELTLNEIKKNIFPYYKYKETTALQHIKLKDCFIYNGKKINNKRLYKVNIKKLKVMTDKYGEKVNII